MRDFANVMEDKLTAIYTSLPGMPLMGCPRSFHLAINYFPFGAIMKYCITAGLDEHVPGSVKYAIVAQRPQQCFDCCIKQRAATPGGRASGCWEARYSQRDSICVIPEKMVVTG